MIPFIGRFIGHYFCSFLYKNDKLSRSTWGMLRMIPSCPYRRQEIVVDVEESYLQSPDAVIEEYRYRRVCCTTCGIETSARHLESF